MTAGDERASLVVAIAGADVRVGYRDGRGRIYALDRGHEIVPICVDLWTADADTDR